MYRDSIRKVILPEGLKIIGMHAFWGLENLEEVIIPQSVTDIRPGAFANCPKLANVKIVRDTYEIGDFKQKNSAPKDCVILWSGAFDDTPWKMNNI